MCFCSNAFFTYFEVYEESLMSHHSFFALFFFLNADQNKMKKGYFASVLIKRLMYRVFRVVSPLVTF